MFLRLNVSVYILLCLRMKFHCVINSVYSYSKSTDSDIVTVLLLKSDPVLIV